MARVFISYRRDDSADVTGRIFDRLRDHFVKQVVFRDVDSIPPGEDFRAIIRQAVEGSRVMLVVIGPSWLTITGEEGRRRLDDPDDFVRVEIESGLARGIPIVPVLVGRARMPSPQDLPTSLRQLAERNAVEVRRDPDFHRDMGRLIDGVTDILKSAPPPTPAALANLSVPNSTLARWEQLQVSLIRLIEIWWRIPVISTTFWRRLWQVTTVWRTIFALLFLLFNFAYAEGSAQATLDRLNSPSASLAAQRYSTDEIVVLSEWYYGGVLRFSWEPRDPGHPFNTTAHG
jgi:hypothetical protein